MSISAYALLGMPRCLLVPLPWILWYTPHDHGHRAAIVVALTGEREMWQ